MNRYLKHGRAWLLVLLGLGAVALSATPAQAQLLAPASCAATTTSTAFAQWGDTNQYKLVDGSAFAPGTTGWALTGGARLGPGGEPFGTIASSPGSLTLPAGASATSPATCVDFSEPSWRFFLQNVSANSTVALAVLHASPLGMIATPIGTVTAHGGWQPSPVLTTASTLQNVLGGGTTSIELKFTALSGTTNIDGVFIDPRMRH